jgi:hypothetical protein
MIKPQMPSIKNLKKEKKKIIINNLLPLLYITVHLSLAEHPRLTNYNDKIMYIRINQFEKLLQKVFIRRRDK